MPRSDTPLLDADGVDQALTSMAVRLRAAMLPGVTLVMVGVRTRGVPLARRLATILTRQTGETIPVGAVDITLYRDDLDRAARWPVLHGTEIPFDIDGADVVLVDDVLFTGRTIRAAINSLCDLGRPARIRLATLVDRGHRELPIQPDVVGLLVATTRDEHVRVRLHEIDGVDEVLK